MRLFAVVGVGCLGTAAVLGLWLDRLLPSDAQRWGIAALCVLGVGFLLTAAGERAR